MEYRKRQEGLIGWQEAMLFLIWKAKQRNLMDFFGVGITI